MSQRPATSPLSPNVTIGVDDVKTQNTSSGGDGTAEPVVPPTAIPGYEILGEIGRGGMGVVYKARHIYLNRVVAIKMILAGSHAGPVELVRFRQEAELVARFQHPNIVQTYEVGAHAGHSYLSLEYVDGGTLSQRTAGAPQTPREAARLVELLARAVDYAHQQGVIHRDLTPGNVLLTVDGAPKLTDFGLARRVGDSQGLTATGAILGTPGYLAPEQISGGSHSITAATDVYGLGAILYYLLTGRPPFQAANLLESIRQTESQDPTRPGQLRSQLPRDLDTICLKCLQKSPGKRYASAAALADDLQRFLAGEPILARPVPNRERAWLWAKRNPAIASLISTVGVLLAVVAIGGILLSLQLASALDQSKKDQKQAESDRDLARKATREGQEKLLQAYIAEAKASRNSRQVGQRFGTLDVLRKAAALARELEQPPAVFTELRNQAIAALALPDLRPADEWVALPETAHWKAPTSAYVVDPAFQKLAAANVSGEITVRHLGNETTPSKEIARITNTTDGSAAWNADGRFLLLREWRSRRLRIWKVDAAAISLAIEQPSNCLSATFTPDGRKLATVSGNGAVRLYDLETAAVERSFKLEPIIRNVLAYCETEGDIHPLSSRLAIATSRGPVIIDLNTEKAIFPLPIIRPIALVRWHPAGQLLALIGGDGVELWDIDRKRLNIKIPMLRETGGVRIAFDPTGETMVTSGWTHRVRLWNPFAGRELITTTGNADRLGAEGRLAARFPGVGTERQGPLTHFEPGREYRTFVSGPDNPKGGISSAALHPNERLMALGTEFGISLVDVDAGCERAFLKGAGRVAIFEPSGEMLVVNGGGLYRWPITFDENSQVRVGPPQPIKVPGPLDRLAVSADGNMIAASVGNGGVVWPREHPEKAIHLGPHGDCRAIAISPDGLLVATGEFNSHGLKVWTSDTGKLVQDFPTDEGIIVPSFSPDGMWLFSSKGQSWRTSDWSPGPVLPTGEVACAPPNVRLAAAGGQKGLIPLFDPATGREFARLEDANQDALFGLTMNGEGSLVLGFTSDGLCAHMWNLRLIRERLAELDLDWAAPPFPPTTPRTGRGPLRIVVEQR